MSENSEQIWYIRAKMHVVCHIFSTTIYLHYYEALSTILYSILLNLFKPHQHRRNVQSYYNNYYR